MIKVHGTCVPKTSSGPMIATTDRPNTSVAKADARRRLSDVVDSLTKERAPLSRAKLGGTLRPSLVECEYDVRPMRG